MASCYKEWDREKIDQEQQYASTIEIIANKERSHGNYFFVVGFLEVDHHNHAFLFRDRESRDHLIFSDAFFLDVAEVNETLQELKGSYVSIEGVYYNDRVHPMFAGRFAEIVTICPKTSLADFNATRLRP